jgi:hypothetical protein
MPQTARVYKAGSVKTEMTPTTNKQALSVWVLGYEYTPTAVSELEIDHTLVGKGVVRYEINSVEHTAITIGNQNVLKLNLSTAGNNGTSSTGLVTELYHGQMVQIRILQNVKFNGISNVNPTRPSTALQYTDDLASIYRIIAYNLTDATGEKLEDNVAILQSDTSFNYYKFVTDPVKITTPDPDDIVLTGAFVSGSTLTTTLEVVNPTGGDIGVGYTLAGTGFTKGQKVTAVSKGPSNTTVTLSAVPNAQPAGTITFARATYGYR